MLSWPSHQPLIREIDTPATELRAQKLTVSAQPRTVPQPDTCHHSISKLDKSPRLRRTLRALVAELEALIAARAPAGCRASIGHRHDDWLGAGQGQPERHAPVPRPTVVHADRGARIARVVVIRETPSVDISRR